MKIIVIGGTGMIGKAVVNELKPRHDVLVAGHEHGDIQIDITNALSIKQLYEKVSHIDAMVMTVGKVHFDSLVKMTYEQYQIGLNDKLMGQINVVLEGLSRINDNGSFTLTSGILSDDPIRFGSSASMVNAAVNGFVTSAAIEMPRGIRINAVSPTVLAESMPVYEDYFRGFEPVPAKLVALAYSKSVEGAQTGQVYKVWR